MPVPWIFTFYSYKGGVGRSLAAANVAYALAGWGRHVLVIDMDLEAPGLSGFLDRAGEFGPPQTAFQPDILTLLAELIAIFRRGDDLDVAIHNLQPVSGYIRRVDPEKLTPLAPKMGELGRLDVLGADLNRNYSERLVALGLHDLEHDELVKVSGLLRNYLKAQRFPRRPFWLESFQPPESTPYDYVIVDSRTGLTEIGGLCVGPLADRLVVVTGLNDQNIEGTRLFLEEVGIKPEARPRDERWDECDEPENGSGMDAALGPKPTIVVASPVPAGEIEAKRVRLKKIEQRLGVAPEQISYHPQMALIESLFVRDYREEYLASQYTRLADRIQARVGDNYDRLAMELNALLANSERNRDWSRAAVDLAIRLAPINTSARVFVSLVGNTIGRAEPSLALPLHALLSQGTSTNDSALTDWGRALSDQANAKEGEEADRLFAAAYEKYAEAVRLVPDHANALNTWGASLSDQAKGKEGEEADRLFAAAYVKHAEAVRLKPDYADALSNWGDELSDQAKTKEEPEADLLFAAAYEKYAEAVRLNPGGARALSNWGDALSDQASEAKRKDEAKADRLFEAAYEKFAAAVRLKPDFADALSNWGNVLTDQAERKDEAKADRLFEAAYEKFAEAVRLKPDYAAALNSWGAALADQARRKQALSTDRPQSEKLLDLARTRLLEAKTKGSRESLFNLARLEAIRGDVNEMISWLRSGIELGDRITKTKLASNSAFDSIRQNPYFVRFTAALPDK